MSTDEDFCMIRAQMYRNERKKKLRIEKMLNGYLLQCISQRENTIHHKVNGGKETCELDMFLAQDQPSLDKNQNIYDNYQPVIDYHSGEDSTPTYVAEEEQNIKLTERTK